MDLRHLSNNDYLLIIPSPGDGHCLLHSVISSCKHQLHHDIDIHCLKSHIFIEANANYALYRQFLETDDNNNFAISLGSYINNKIYNNSFGDILPLIVSNALKINLTIYDQRERNTLEKIDIHCTQDNPQTTIILHRHGDHYNGAAKVHRSDSGLFQSNMGDDPSVIYRQLSRPVVRHLESEPNYNDLQLKVDNKTKPSEIAQQLIGVSSCAKEGSDMIHRQLSRPVVKCPNQVITYSSDDLHKLRPPKTNIKRCVRKKLFSCNIWKPQDTHFQCNNNQARPFDLNKGAHHSLLREIPKSNAKSYQQANVTSNNLKFILMNSQSIKNKDIAIRQIFDDSNADFAIITETWLSEDDDVWIMSSDLNNNGLSMRTVNRQGRVGGGIALIHSTKIKVKEKITGAKASFEYGVWQTQINKITTTVIALYRPPYSERNRSSIATFCDELSDLLSEVMAGESNIVLTGDFNIHIFQMEDRNAQLFMEFTQSMGFNQHVNGPTQRAGNTLDLIFTETASKLNVIRCENVDYISDHCAILCELNMEKEPTTVQRIKYRNYKGINLTELQNDISIETSGIDKVDDLVSIFDEKVRTAIDKHAPEKEKTVTIRRKNPWFSPEIRQHRSDARKKERIWRSNKSSQNWKIFCQARTKYTNLLKHTKICTVSDRIAECNRNTKQLYQVFNSVTGNKPDRTMPDSPSDAELANCFADYFMDKINSIRDALDKTPIYKPSGSSPDSLSSFNALSERDVQRIIISLSTKSCELDPIPTSILKSILPGLLPVITKIINLSLAEGKFVSTWKTAIVRPLLKKAGQDPIYKNYRPVSNLCFLSKVLEKAVLNQFTEYCDRHSLFPNYQSAYRRHFSCETALIKLFNDILWNMENKEVTAMLAIDLSAAFDTVDHEVLLDILQVNFGINDKALHWFDSYLRPRKCKVNINSAYSSTRDLNFSVPQGSCAGPVLFSVYASTIRNVVNDNISLHGYADDHALKTSFKPGDHNEESQSMDRLIKCMDNIKKWMDSNRLKMNASKTEFILLGSRQQLEKCTSGNICIDGATISNLDSIKYLGVTLDKYLTLRQHITNKCKIAMWQIKRIRNIRKMLTKDACQTLVLGLVISHLDYSNALYIGLSKCELKRLQRVQNIASKLVLQAEDSATRRLKLLHWLPIHLRIKYKVLTMVYKCLHNQAPRYLQELLQLHQTGRSGLRSQSIYLRLKVPFTSCVTFAGRSFRAVAPIWWNDIPNHIKASENVDTFKARLKTFLFDKF